MTATVIRNAEWVVAWDDEEDCHIYLHGCDVAWQDGALIHIGGRYEGGAAEEISGHGRMVIPGLVNLHTHTSTMPVFKSVREEIGNPQLYLSALYDGWNLFTPAAEDKFWASRYAYGEMLLSGVTSYVDMCFPYPGWVDAAAESGLRAFLSPLYQSASWRTDNGHELLYDWKDDDGHADMEESVGVIDAAITHPSGMLDAVVSPMAIDTCSLALIHESYALARERGLPFQLHCGEAMMEFLEITRRHGVSQVQLLARERLLGPDVTLGHGLFLDHHSWLHWSTRADIGLLADHGVSVAHCPTPFSRYGITLEHFGRYLEEGVVLGIGTDTHPHNMLEEMRTAAIMGRVAAENMHAVSTANIFNAATVGGAHALKRGDIGRLQVGAKADLVSVALDDPTMMPVYDPLRSLIYTAADRAVRDVWIDGRQCVADGKVTTLDMEDIASNLQEVQIRALEKVPQRDRLGRNALQVAPLTFRSRRQH
ncbi:MAG: N-ethylammeline chlorohydrolase [Rhodospirillaceae bacterium]|nr:N-ethylammeline chlorohydrolase [Rhodospirillaceae bacterium]|tara:strand:- start:21070 stop:22512 length:1443 start_codon:yes stop_codon:yes gene_type:complete